MTNYVCMYTLPRYTNTLVCWLVKCKVRVRIPVQASKRNMKIKIFLRRFPLSRFLSKTLSVNKPDMKNFLKKKKKKKSNVWNRLSTVGPKPLTYKINAHNMSGMRS